MQKVGNTASYCFPPLLQVLATTEEKPGIIYAELDYGELEKRRQNMPLVQQKRYDLYSLIDKTM